MALKTKKTITLFSSLLLKPWTDYTSPATVSVTVAAMNHHNNNHNSPSYTTDPNTMFVQADPSDFRNIVQKLTGAPSDQLYAAANATGQQKLPLTPKKPAFKLHERRQSTKKMELKLNNITNDTFNHFQRGFLVSPVSHLDPYWTRVSPHSAREEQRHAPLEKEEEKAIAEKGFYLHPSPRNGAEPAPQLLPLFPLSSPKTVNHI